MRLDKEIIILIAEDSPDDFGLIHRALVRTIPGVRLPLVFDAKQAVAYLAGEGEYANRERFPLPHLVLCDLKMPNGDGYMLLEWIKVHPRFRKLPVIIMSASVAGVNKRMLEKGATDRK